MEDVLDLYEEPPDEKNPVVCLDEKPYQLTDDIREPLSVLPGESGKEDYTYKRNGTCNLFVMLSPQLGWRHVKVTDRRTSGDCAEILRELVDVHFPDADKIRIVCDNLNTHKGASLYETFPAEEAHGIYKRLEFHYTPRHASWLNMAEIEIRVLGKQCIDRRIGSQDKLNGEISKWESERNHHGVHINWQFTTKKARVKFEKHYDKLIN